MEFFFVFPIDFSSIVLFKNGRGVLCGFGFCLVFLMNTAVLPYRQGHN